ncbi:Uncharacterized protein APZ42_029794 [Daphnia magna]|uniref:Uncharacterized protein n=1 Tax=Daphnia magna TaxID=35525 RepID=A0A164PBJ9_9CRUS|nr:Uncharacterized protein APZ42_029794 [Daphnia magna]
MRVTASFFTRSLLLLFCCTKLLLTDPVAVFCWSGEFSRCKKQKNTPESFARYSTWE